MNKRLEPWVVFGAGALVAGLGAWLYAGFILTLCYNFEARRRGTGSRRIGTLWRRFS